MDEATARRKSPALVWANWYRFHPDQSIHHETVESECFIWSVQGSGRITSKGQELLVQPGSIVWLPWVHDVEYRASSRNPFHLGTLHLVPDHSREVPVDFVVAHDSRPELLGSPYRRGGERLSSLRQVSTQSTAAREFLTLATYCVDRFMSRAMDEDTSRSLGVLVANEAARMGDKALAEEWPAVLLAMTHFVLQHIEKPLTVAEIAASGSCSATTTQRLFTQYTGRSVIGWVRATRMQEAARLLRTTGMRVNEVARATGFDDPLYFSRVFRDAFGVAPSKYLSGHLTP